ncbi:MAG TPA: hypothetical protein VGC91_12065 [Pyrinomonadaceae bacterium]|jgi:hypothetical protein
MFKRTLPLIAATFLLLAASSAYAQSKQPERKKETPPPPAAQTQAPPETDSADLSITANVTARELRFEVVPTPTVTFTGNPERKTTWDASRQNLPRPVQPFVTYRNIGIQLKITSVFADIDRIVAEALGEAPVTDNIPPPAANATVPGSPPSSSTRTTAAQPVTSSTAKPSSPVNTPAGKGRP